MLAFIAEGTFAESIYVVPKFRFWSGGGGLGFLGLRVRTWGLEPGNTFL